MFYYLLIVWLVKLTSPILLIGLALLILWLALLAGKAFIRDALIDSIELYTRLNSARLDIAEHRATVETKRQQLARLLADQHKALNSGLPLTVNERFTSGEFDIELE